MPIEEEYSALISTLQQGLFISPGPAFVPLLYVAIGLIALSIRLAIGCLYSRLLRTKAARNEFWLFRVASIRDSHSSLLLPNAVNCWIIAWIPIAGTMLTFSIKTIFATNIEFDLTDFALLRSVAFSPLFVLLWTMSCASTIAPLCSPIRKQGRIDFARYPMLLNIFFISCPVFFLILVIYFGIKSNDCVNRVYEIYLVMLKEQEDSTIINAERLKGHLKELGIIAAQLGFFWQSEWASFLSFSIVHFLVLVPTSISHLMTIRSAIKLSSTSSSNSAALQRLKQNYLSVAVSSYATALLSLSYIATSSVLIYYDGSSSSGVGVSAYISVFALMLFGIAGIGTNSAILYRSRPHVNTNEASDSPYSPTGSSNQRSNPEGIASEEKHLSINSVRVDAGDKFKQIEKT